MNKFDLVLKRVDQLEKSLQLLKKSHNRNMKDQWQLLSEMSYNKKSNQ